MSSKTIGTCSLLLEDPSTEISAEGRNFISSLQIISINHLDSAAITATFYLTNDPSRFHGKVFPARSLSNPMKLKVEKDIKDKLREGILIPCSNPIVPAPIVPVVKSNGEVRICDDYTMTANKIIDPGSYHIPTFEEIIENNGHATHYSKINLKQAYLQIPLSEEAQKYTTISIHMGYFNFTRLPFGISACPRVFQEFMDQVLQDVPGARAYQDDILIGGPTKAEHDKRLCLVQQRLTQFNLKPCNEKSVYCVTKVHFLGFLQVKPDSQRLAAFEKMPSPKDKQQPRSALGTLLYYCKFLQNFSSMAAPLDLLKKDARFLWTRQHEKHLLAINFGDGQSNKSVHLRSA